MAKRILIMGLPGAGKTYLATALKKYMETHSDFFNPAAEALYASGATVEWFNADDVRKRFNDWDFSHEGRIRQSHRMRELADKSAADFVIADFVAPLPEMRHNFKADWCIWVDTIEAGRFEDTNRVFDAPDVYDFRVIEQDADKWAEFIGNHIIDDRRRPVFDWQKETVQMLGPPGWRPRRLQGRPQPRRSRRPCSAATAPRGRGSTESRCGAPRQGRAVRRARGPRSRGREPGGARRQWPHAAPRTRRPRRRRHAPRASAGAADIWPRGSDAPRAAAADSGRRETDASATVPVRRRCRPS